MKSFSFYLFCSIAFFAYASFSYAQPTCENPLIVINDDFEAYTPGEIGAQSDHWTTLSGMQGGVEEGIIATDLPFSGNISLKLDEVGQNAFLKLGDSTKGMYILEWKIYVFTGTGASFSLQHKQPGIEIEEAARFDFSIDGVASISTGPGIRFFSFTQDDWIDMRFLIDLDNDYVYFYSEGDLIHTWPFSWQLAGQNGLKVLSGVNFKVRDAADLFYLEDFLFQEISPAEGGKYCHIAEPIDVGVHSVGELECFGAGFTVRSAGQGRAGMWYSYTPTEDGILSVSSCNQGGDSRVWIFSGGCDALKVEGVNDDLCEIVLGGGDDWASYREVLVKANETYLICWDDIWETGNFDFELAFSNEAPTPGNFCESAIPVTPGMHVIDTIDGTAATSGPNINHTGSSTTNYAKSEWYSFTPETQGIMTVSSCGLTTEDTRLWIYTGECGIENITLLGSDDDFCDLQSSLALDVEAGTTYYIEWDNEDLNTPGFPWQLNFIGQVSTQNKQFFNSLTVSPNPTNGMFNVRYQLPQHTDLEIQIFDYLGKLVEVRQIDGTISGSENIDLSNQSAGLYFAHISNGQYFVTEKIVVQK